MPERILVVEDEETLRRNVARYLEQGGYEVDAFAAAETAILSLGDHEYAAALVDLRLPRKDGLTLAGEIHARQPDTPVILMTAYGSLESVIDALRAGVQDYLLKPVLLKDVARKVAHACEHRRLVRENARLRQKLAERAPPPEIVARSRVMVDLVAFARQLAPSSRTVLVEGESGSGKEVVARLVHDASPRREGPFVAVSVASIPEAAFEACLFGHEKGAYPGAESRREGLFRAAAGGTLFLDDIAELSLANQAKLLRAVEAKEVLPVGGDLPFAVDARIVAASSADLGALVKGGRFRSDLYFRLSALRLALPPLRRRPEDILPLAEAFLVGHAKEHGRRVTGFDPAAQGRLLAYGWPGNVRELSNVVERAALSCGGALISLADLPPEIAGAATGGGDYQEAMADFERALIRSTLDRVGDDRREAARVLGLSLATLYRRLEKLGLKESASPPAAAAPDDRREG